MIMTGHLKILIGFVFLLIGIITTLYLRQIHRRYRDSALWSLYQYMIFLMVLFTGIVISKYIKINLVDSVTVVSADVYLNIGTLVLILTQIGMIYSLLGVCLRLNRLPLPGAVNYGTLTLISLVSVSYLLRIVLAGFQINIAVMNQIHSMLWNSLLLLELPLLLFFVFYRNSGLSDNVRRVSLSFSLLYFSRFPLVLGLLYLARQFQAEYLQLVFPAGFFIYYIAVPVIWAKIFYIPAAESLLSRAESGNSLQEFLKKQGLSKREQEILRLLVEGKSNRDIAEKLFIALPTVKNHVYNIFQKSGVSSRYQLIHLIINNKSTVVE